MLIIPNVPIEPNKAYILSFCINNQNKITPNPTITPDAEFANKMINQSNTNANMFNNFFSKNRGCTIAR